jgi:hypothetical protein
LARGLKLILPERTAVLVSDPTLLLAISSAVWFSASGSESDIPEGFRSELLPFGLPPEYVHRLILADSRSSRHLSWTSVPYGTNQIQRSTYRQVSKPTYVPPSGFGYPLDGFLPLNPSEFAKDSPRPWDYPFGASSFKQGKVALQPLNSPLAVLLAFDTGERAPQYGIARRSFWASALARKHR